MTRRIPASRAVPAVIAATRYLAAHEFSAPGDPYDRLRDMVADTDTAGRIEIAAAAYLHGSERLRSSRALDGCFESGDGTAVANALAARADLDPALFAAIASDFSGTFPAKWRAPSLLDYLHPAAAP